MTPSYQFSGRFTCYYEILKSYLHQNHADFVHVTLVLLNRAYNSAIVHLLINLPFANSINIQVLRLLNSVMDSVLLTDHLSLFFKMHRKRAKKNSMVGFHYFDVIQWNSVMMK